MTKLLAVFAAFILFNLLGESVRSVGPFTLLCAIFLALTFFIFISREDGNQTDKPKNR